MKVVFCQAAIMEHITVIKIHQAHLQAFKASYHLQTAYCSGKTTATDSKLALEQDQKIDQLAVYQDLEIVKEHKKACYKILQQAFIMVHDQTHEQVIFYQMLHE